MKKISLIYAGYGVSQTPNMVTKRKDWYKNKFISIFGGVKIWEIEDYYVFMAVKMNSTYAKANQRRTKNF